MSDAFAPTLAAAHARIATVQPTIYARTRNQLDGAVSTLSPYITHGFVTLADVLAGVAARHALEVQNKFVYELGWREYFRHVWQHCGEGIFKSLHEGPLPDAAYARELPDDIREGRTGVPAIDEGVRVLYATGTLHNHARMWLASYVVHVRKVHWRAGADWLYGHLLDGDLASNHLSWQWVAGTSSRKPYLFNADNVARYAPSTWHSPGSVIDASYEALDHMAHEPVQHDRSEYRDVRDRSSVLEPRVTAEPPDELGLTAPDAAVIAGKDVWLVHPWSLGDLPDALLPNTHVIGVLVADFHRAWPWNERRWRFVGSRMAELTATRWYADAAIISAALKKARSVSSIDEPHLARWLTGMAECVPAAVLFPAVEQRCDSFSQWWTHVSRGVVSASDLVAVT